YLFGADFAGVFAGHIEFNSARMVLGYGLCFVSVLIVGALLGFIMHKLVQGTGLSGTDRLLGMFFGLARGLFLVTLAVLLLGFTPFPGDPWWHQSRLLPGFQGAASWFGQRLPDGMEKYLSYAPAVAAALQPPQPTAHSTIPAAARSVDSKKVEQDRF
ncbi:MAG: CvpA family protein, partial [Xanthomonadales bacterium]|nr:CvpA family protein [Xanthomonadales bacterium]